MIENTWYCFKLQLLMLYASHLNREMQGKKLITSNYLNLFQWKLTSDGWIGKFVGFTESKS